MNRFVRASIAAVPLLMLAGVAVAAPKPSHHQAWLNWIRSGGVQSEVGEPFVADRAGNPRAECEAAGGVLKSQIQDDGSLAFQCLTPAP